MERTAARLHLVLATAGVTLLVAFSLLLVPNQSGGQDSEERLETAGESQAATVGLRGNVLAWAGAGLAVGAAIGGGIGALILLRRESRRIEEGR
jgi:hypothetical protein